MEYAYNSSYVLERMVEQAQKIGYDYEGPMPVSTLLWNSWWPPTEEKVAAFVPNSERIFLKAVVLESPGVWDFLGSLNPLKSILEYINLRHEMRKDYEYREGEEARKLKIENDLLETQLIRERLAIIREIGATENDLSILKDQLLGRSFKRLHEFQDVGLITYAQVIEEGEEYTSPSDLPDPPSSYRY
ncbi:MAG: hypothetical protein GVY17_06820 [Cyanobacteria bacterium]|nr:hypothetical protein [Cyanobacteria bacterium GSL.Bin21]